MRKRGEQRRVGLRDEPIALLIPRVQHLRRDVPVPGSVPGFAVVGSSRASAPDENLREEFDESERPRRERHLRGGGSLLLRRRRSRVFPPPPRRRRPSPSWRVPQAPPRPPRARERPARVPVQFRDVHQQTQRRVEHVVPRAGWIPRLLSRASRGGGGSEPPRRVSARGSRAGSPPPPRLRGSAPSPG